MNKKGLSEVIATLLIILIVISAVLILLKYSKNIIEKLSSSSEEGIAKFSCPSQLTLTYFGCIKEDGNLYLRINNIGDPILSSSLIIFIGNQNSTSMVFADPYPETIEGIHEYNLVIPENIGNLQKIKLMPSIQVKNSDKKIICSNLNEQDVKNC